MSAAAGIVGGALCLMALDAAVKTQGAKELTGAFKVAQSAVRILVDPTVPLIPDRRKPTVDNPIKQPKSQQPKSQQSSTDSSAPALHLPAGYAIARGGR